MGSFGCKVSLPERRDTTETQAIHAARRDWRSRARQHESQRKLCNYDNAVGLRSVDPGGTRAASELGAWVHARVWMPDPCAPRDEICRSAPTQGAGEHAWPEFVTSCDERHAKHCFSTGYDFGTRRYGTTGLHRRTSDRLRLDPLPTGNPSWKGAKKPESRED